MSVVTPRAAIAASLAVIAARAGERLPPGQLREEKRQPDGKDARRVGSGHDVLLSQRDRGRDLGDRHLRPERESFRRRQLARDGPVRPPFDGDRNEPCLFLEGHGDGSVERTELARRRQNEGRADVRVARERDLDRGREDAHAPRVPGLGRQHERRLGEVELARDLLHPGVRDAARVRQHGERIAAERGVREDVAVQVAVLHRVTAARGAPAAGTSRSARPTSRAARSRGSRRSDRGP